MPTGTSSNIPNPTPSMPQQIVDNHYSTNNPYYMDEKKDSIVLNFFKGFIRWIFDSVQVIIIALAIFIIFYLFIISPHTIDGESMQPTFCNNDFVLADKFTPRFKPYTRGDVIVFKHDESNDYIKRIIGIGGDKIRIQGGRVYRNDQLLEETYLPAGRKTSTTSDKLREGQTYTVPQGKFFVMGDNRGNSLDSRAFLAIDPNINTIKGRAVFTIWPFSNAHIFDKDAAQPDTNCDVRKN